MRNQSQVLRWVLETHMMCAWACSSACSQHINYRQSGDCTRRLLIGQVEQRACRRWRRAFAYVTQLQQLWADGWGSLRYYQVTLTRKTQHYTNFMHNLPLEYTLCFDVQWGKWKVTWRDHFLEDLARITLRPVLVLDRCATLSCNCVLPEFLGPVDLPISVLWNRVECRSQPLHLLLP